uniref:Putative ovule protein n=1 Tax=Solanum chacoense TaxID=4108 RepID=A0A0V0H8E6_SOLCH
MLLRRLFLQYLRLWQAEFLRLQKAFDATPNLLIWWTFPFPFPSPMIWLISQRAVMMKKIFAMEVSL